MTNRIRCTPTAPPANTTSSGANTPRLRRPLLAAGALAFLVSACGGLPSVTDAASDQPHGQPDIAATRTAEQQRPGSNEDGPTDPDGSGTSRPVPSSGGADGGAFGGVFGAPTGTLTAGSDDPAATTPPTPTPPTAPPTTPPNAPPATAPPATAPPATAPPATAPPATAPPATAPPVPAPPATAVGTPTAPLAPSVGEFLGRWNAASQALADDPATDIAQVIFDGATFTTAPALSGGGFTTVGRDTTGEAFVGLATDANGAVTGMIVGGQADGARPLSAIAPLWLAGETDVTTLLDAYSAAVAGDPGDVVLPAADGGTWHILDLDSVIVFGKTQNGDAIVAAASVTSLLLDTVALLPPLS